jgi:hypothetical protein
MILTNDVVGDLALVSAMSCLSISIIILINFCYEMSLDDWSPDEK